MSTTHDNLSKLRGDFFRRMLGWGVALVVALAIGGGAIHVARERHETATLNAMSDEATLPRVALLPGTKETLALPRDVIDALGVRTAMAEPATQPEPLRLAGSLFLDPNRLVNVHTRFAGEVVEIGKTVENGQERPLRLNDKVKAGQLLAVIWSKDVGEKKSDLVDALSKLWLDEATLARLNALAAGVVPKRTILEAQHDREADVNAVERARRTLKSWRISDAEIAAVEAEAKRIHNDDNSSNDAVDTSWAEVDVRAPLDGVILEKNVVIGDIVDTDRDLFKVADLSRLGVLANVYEEDIAALEGLPTDKRHWLISLKADPNMPPIVGYFELIGNVIDPNQHTGTVIGWVANDKGLFRVGQFITATVELPAPSDEVSVPSTAVIDRGSYSTVLVANNAAAQQVTQRKVSVVHRGQNNITIRAQLRPVDEEQGLQVIKPGELVVTAGNVELSGALEDLQGDLTTD